ncbi:MAG: hypothetical protein FJZ63_06835, partial [Chlamydiae bacterium]|nr:hypothetical protein [Chlamydiota bacterium]
MTHFNPTISSLFYPMDVELGPEATLGTLDPEPFQLLEADNFPQNFSLDRIDEIFGSIYPPALPESEYDSPLFDGIDNPSEIPPQPATAGRTSDLWTESSITHLITLACASLQDKKIHIWDNIPWKIIAETLDHSFEKKFTPRGCSAKLLKILQHNTISNIQFPTTAMTSLKKLMFIKDQLRQGWNPVLDLPSRTKTWTKQSVQMLSELATGGKYSTLDQMVSDFNANAALTGAAPVSRAAVGAKLSRDRIMFVKSRVLPLNFSPLPNVETGESSDTTLETKTTRLPNFLWNDPSLSLLITLAGESLQGPQGALTWDSIPWEAIANTLRTTFQGNIIPSGCSIRLTRILKSDTISNIQFPPTATTCFKKLTYISEQLQQGWEPELHLPPKETKWTEQAIQTLKKMATGGEYSTLDQMIEAFNAEAALAGTPQVTRAAVETKLSRS